MRTPHLPLAIALAATLLASAAQAQSSYAMTTLSTPASSVGFAATAMDNNGRVAGFMQYRDGTLYASAGDIGALFNCPFGCAVYSARTVTWPAGTAATAAATAGIVNFIPATLNPSGNMFGYNPLNKWLKKTVTVPVTPGSPKEYGVQFSRYNVYEAVVLNGQSWSTTYFSSYGINPNDEVIGSSYIPELRDDMTGNVIQPYSPYLPSTYKNGQTIRTALPAPYVTGRYTAMNGVGVGAGQVATALDGPFVNAQWAGGNLSLINLPATYAPVSINNAGQVLMQEPGTSGKAAIWFNGAATSINGNGKRVYATAMNSSGTVVGCTQNVVSTPKRSDNTAFIWRNGVLQDLSQVLTSKGVTLPSGTRLGCPVAINDSGSILAYYYRTASVNTVTWVRFTARP
jgi:hypothetical protein